VATRGRREPRFAVQITAVVWEQEVERYEEGSKARLAAERARTQLERDRLAVGQLEPCAELGPEGPRLKGLVKVYVPISDASPSQRPFAFVLDGGQDEHGPYLALVAFGERHPERPRPAASTSGPTSACTVPRPVTPALSWRRKALVGRARLARTVARSRAAAAARGGSRTDRDGTRVPARRAASHGRARLLRRGQGIRARCACPGRPSLLRQRGRPSRPSPWRRLSPGCPPSATARSVSP
jgi:hypothetical protein